MISARVAQIEDEEHLQTLIDAGVAEVAEKKGGERWLSTEGAWINEVELSPLLTTLPVSTVAAGRLGGDDPLHPTVVVGCIGAVPVSVATLALSGPVAQLTAIFTLPEARGVGVGDALLAECERFALAAGATVLESVALPGDRHTKNFFEAHGMVSRLLVVSRSLS